MDVPELTEDLIDKIAGQSDDQSGHMSIRELERARDNNLVTILRGLKAQDFGAGALLNAQDVRLSRPAAMPADVSAPLDTVRRAIPLDWTDYNGHMNEARYLQAFGDATDRLMDIVGCNADYIANGGSYFTAETHIRHLDEVHAGTRIHIDTQILLGAGKKMHLFHRMYADDRLLATGEHMLIHVDLATRRAFLADREIDLTPTEFSILELLMRHDGQVVTRKMLCEHVWGFEWDGPTNVIEVHVTRLRKKLDRDGGSRINTIRGRGYSVNTSGCSAV
jgi:carnitine 3-dehydrogenase